MSKIEKDKFNLIVSGCGTGKTKFATEHLPVYYQNENISPSEIIFVCSRSMIVEQQTTIRDGQLNNLSKFYTKDIETIKKWNGLDPPEEEYLDDPIDTLDGGIKAMTMNKLIHILNYCNNPNYDTLCKVKIIIFDECHALFSDYYIRDINMLKLWIRMSINRNEKIFIGMTATPNILIYYQKIWGINTHLLNQIPIINYKVNNLYCVSFASLPLLFSSPVYKDTFSGKTLIMCKNIPDCYRLHHMIKNSAVLVSKYSKEFTSEMDTIRNFIILNQTLPDVVKFNGHEFPLEVLIATSTIREGVNLNDISCGVKNIVCCLPDELDIIQFTGRCRFDIENLIVVNEYSPKTNFRDDYIESCKKDFYDYINDSENELWLNSIKHLLSDNTMKPIRLLLDNKSFTDYILKNWIEKFIYSDTDKNEIVKIAIGCKIIKGAQTKVTFLKVLTYIEEELHMIVQTGRCTIDGVRYTYKKIIANKRKE